MRECEIAHLILLAEDYKSQFGNVPRNIISFGESYNVIFYWENRLLVVEVVILSAER